MIQNTTANTPLSLPKKLLIISATSIFVFSLWLSDRVCAITMILACIVLANLMDKTKKAYGVSALSIAQCIGLMAGTFANYLNKRPSAPALNTFFIAAAVNAVVAGLAILFYFTGKKHWLISLLVAQILYLVYGIFNVIYSIMLGKNIWFRLIFHPLFRILLLYMIIKSLKQNNTKDIQPETIEMNNPQP